MRTATSEKSLRGLLQSTRQSLWAALPPRFSGTTAILILAVGWRPRGSRQVPVCGGTPCTRARYSLRTSRRAKASLMRRRVGSSRATSRRPLVSLSRRWTTPGRRPSCSRRRGKWCSRRWTSVFSGQEGQGWTVRPAGLLHSSRCSSCQRMSTASSSARSSLAVSGRARTTSWPARSLREAVETGIPSMRQAPAVMARCTAARERPGKRPHRALSSRCPARAPATRKSSRRGLSPLISGLPGW